MPTRVNHVLRASKPEERVLALDRAQRLGRADIKSFAKCLGTSWVTAKGLVYDGKVQSLTWGRRRVVLWEEIQRYLREGPLTNPIPLWSEDTNDDDTNTGTNTNND